LSNGSPQPSKGCFKIEGEWATVYIFDFNKHQGKIVRLNQIEKGKIHDMTLEQISLEQQDYEFRECNHLPDVDAIPDRKEAQLRDKKRRQG